MNDVWMKHFSQSYNPNECKDVNDGSTYKFRNERNFVADTSSIWIDAHLKRYIIDFVVVLNEYIIDPFFTRYDKKRSYTFGD